MLRRIRLDLVSHFRVGVLPRGAFVHEAARDPGSAEVTDGSDTRLEAGGGRGQVADTEWKAGHRRRVGKSATSIAAAYKGSRRMICGPSGTLRRRT